VIVVGTKAYRSNEKGKGYQDIEASSLMQMIGRAGRPGLDSTGVAVVLTDNNSKKRIENLLDTGFGPAKSSLCARLPEVMNTEISQQVVTSTVGALRWLQTTFLYSCMKQNEKDPVASAQALSNDAVQYLKDIGIVEVEDQNSIRALVGSHIMNRHSVPFETMKAITAFPFDVSQCQILRSISKLETLHSFVRRNERVELKEFHKTELMKYKLPGPLSKFTVKDPSEKAFILLQSSISRHKFKNEMLNSVHDIVVNEGIKFLQAAQEYSVKASKHGKVALECHKLHRSLHLSLWGESSGVFNQIGWIGGESTIEKTNDLIFNGIRSFQDALDSSEEKLSKILCKHYTLQQNPGRELKKEALIFSRDRLRLFAELVYTRNSNTPVELICTLIYNDPSRAMTKKDGEQSITFSLIAYTDNSVDSKLMFEENISSPSTFRYGMNLISNVIVFVY
ncbi:MAG: ATP-dependent DNA helicase HFM1/MER3, partial [Bacillariaceae sp.]|jgi:ATP-dependent DNA helicase HFM1/MER3